MQSPAGQAAQEIAVATSECMNVLALLAAPKLLRRWRKSLPASDMKVAVTGCLSRFVEATELLRPKPGSGVHAPQVAASTNEGLLKAAVFAEELRAHVGAWDAAGEASVAVTDLARKTLEAIGFPSPPEGWDGFEGEPGMEGGSDPEGQGY